MDLKDTRVLVTGGAGFIGSEVTRQLAASAGEVLVVDNLVNGSRENLANLPDSVCFHEADIRDSDRMMELLRGVDIVLHLACLGVRHSIHSPRDNHDVNATGTLDLLTAARANDVRRFVYVSSSEVYGSAQWVPMTEDHPTRPHTVYGASKLVGECYARAYHDTYKFPVVVVRPFNTYGPRCHHEGDSGEAIPKFMLRAMAGRPMVIFGDGLQTRDFAFVSDTARGILLAGLADEAVGKTLNLGGGAEIRIKDLATEVAHVLGIEAPKIEHIESRPGDVLRLYADPSKARDLCGYSATVSLSEGLAKLKDWYLQGGVAPEMLLEQEKVRNWEPHTTKETVSSFIPVAKPLVGEGEAKAAARVIRSRWLTQGPEVSRFEKEFADYVGAPHACAVSSCTTALHLALEAVGVGIGDEVITVSHSFLATANSIRYCGAMPVFVDIEPGTFNINPSLIEQAMSAKTKAILCVHQMGLPCNLAAIVNIAHRFGLPVVEDAACAAGSEIYWKGGWERIGKPHGDVACFSLHPRKLLTAGDGGLLTTTSSDIDRRFRLRRQHGMDIPDSVRHSASHVVFESYSELGYNYRMTDLQAAVAREQLRRLPEMLRRRQELVKKYESHLERGAGITLPKEPEWARTNWQSYCVRLDADLHQRDVMQKLLDRGIATRRGVMCAHREPAYDGVGWRCGSLNCNGGRSCNHLRESEAAQDHCVILPLFHDLMPAQQEKVAVELIAATKCLCPADATVGQRVD
jgi:perosamine synthetase